MLDIGCEVVDQIAGDGNEIGSAARTAGSDTRQPRARRVRTDVRVADQRDAQSVEPSGSEGSVTVSGAVTICREP